MELSAESRRDGTYEEVDAEAGVGIAPTDLDEAKERRLSLEPPTGPKLGPVHKRYTINQT